MFYSKACPWLLGVTSPSSTFTAILGGLDADIASLEKEAVEVYEALVRPGWGGPLHGLPNVLYGLMMRCFSFVDLWSAYWQGSQQSQSLRMVEWLVKYVPAVDREVASVAVQMWRHTLMHTGQPRRLRDNQTGREYMWLLHWGDEIAANQHLTVWPGSPRNLQLSLLRLVSGLQAALGTFSSDVRSDPHLQHNVESMHSQLQVQSVKIY